MKEYLLKLNDRQREAVLATEGPILVNAAAGSGKTGILISRIAHLIHEGVNPKSILAVTFTNKAAKEMKERLESLIGDSAREVWMGTFHSICIRLLKSYAQFLDPYDKNFSITDEADSKKIITTWIAREGCNWLEYSHVKYAISKWKNDLITPNQALLEADSDYNRAIAEAYLYYQQELKRNNSMDFDDLIFNTVMLLKENQEFKNKCINMFKYLLVDEYQDINGQQYELIKELSSKYRNIFAVGDDYQAIYSFRFSNISMILNFERDFPDAKIIKLEQNYRSSNNIVNATSILIKNNEAQKEKNVWTENESGDPIYIKEFFDDRSEADWIVSTIKELVRIYQIKYSDIAILYRTNYCSRKFEDILIRNRVPHIILGSMSFYDRKEIKDIVSYLKVICNKSDSLAIQRAIEVPKRGIGAKTVERINDYARHFNMSFYEAMKEVDKIPRITGKTKTAVEDFVALIDSFSSEKSPLQVFREVIEKTNYIGLELSKVDDKNDREENLREFERMCIEYEREYENPTLSDFLQEISLFTDLDRTSKDTNAVRLMTAHASKGLEYDVVFVVDATDDLFPMSMAKSEAEIEEERRLFYVATTRAKKLLYIVYTQTRMHYDGIIPVKPSRFIDELPNEYIYVLE